MRFPTTRPKPRVEAVEYARNVSRSKSPPPVDGATVSKRAALRLDRVPGKELPGPSTAKWVQQLPHENLSKHVLSGSYAGFKI